MKKKLLITILGMIFAVNIGLFMFNTISASDVYNPNNNLSVAAINNAYQKADKDYPMMVLALYVDEPSYEDSKSISITELMDFMNTMMNRGYSPSIVFQPYERVKGQWVIIWNKDRYAVWEVPANAN